MMNGEDIPLTEAFYDNPLEYMQTYVRNLNNELFLSEYHINNLYALLLLGRTSPWDQVRGNSDNLRQQIDGLVTQKVKDVKTILESLSNVYEDKAKKNALNQIERLMGILKSKKKAIYIEKNKSAQNIKQFELFSQLMAQGSGKEGIDVKSPIGSQEFIEKEMERQSREQIALSEEGQKQEVKKQQVSATELKEVKNQQEYGKQPEPEAVNKLKQYESKPESIEQKPKQEEQLVPVQPDNKEQGCGACSRCGSHADKSSSSQPSMLMSGTKEVFTIFYGLTNITNLSALALTNLLDHNSADRSIKFKMSDNYNVTIQSQDPLYYDRTSALRTLPGDIYCHHVFPYLTASELFQVRGVCKQWLENVKQTWHSTFKREMYIQLLACEFCKDIEFFYKTIQLRNPFFQKLSLLIHALIEIIQWDTVNSMIDSPTLPLQIKRIFLVLLRLLGEPIPFTTLNSINDALYETHKHRLANLKQKMSQFFNALSGTDMSINALRDLKTHILDDAFMRAEEMSSQDKTPLLLTLLVKQITLQQILRNHIYFAQEYLLNTKKRLDHISKKMVYQKGYLEGVYKILLLKNSPEHFAEDKEQPQMPDFHTMVQSMFSNGDREKPDFTIRSETSSTEIFFDKATKLDLLLATVWSFQQGRAGPETKEESREEEEHWLNSEQARAARSQKQEKNAINNEINLQIGSEVEQESSGSQTDKEEKPQTEQ